MQTESYQLADYLSAFRRRFRIMIMISIPVLLIAAGLAIGLPDVYRSVAELRIDMEGQNVDILEPIALTRYADQYIASLEDKALSWENLQAWNKEIGVFPDAGPDATEAELIARMSDDIRITMTTTAVTERTGKEVDLITGFSAGFESAYPEIAQKVAEKMATAFLEEDRATRTEQAATASGFLREQIAKRQTEILELERQVAAFKERNACCLPDLLNLNMNIMDRTEREIDQVQSEMRSLEQNRVFRVSQIEEIKQKAASSSRLVELQQEYSEKAPIYGDDHPDIKKLKAQIIALTASADATGENADIAKLQVELTALRERYTDDHPDVIKLKRRLEQLATEPGLIGSSSAEEHPEYLRLVAEVDSIDTRLRGMRSRLIELRTKLDGAERNVGRTPQVERELLALNRDLDTARQGYDDLQDRLMLAQQTEAFETEIGARLTLTRTARVPDRPASPPRTAIIVLGLVLAMSLGGMAAILAEGADSTVRGRRDIVNLASTQPIATVPVIENSLSRSDRHRKYVLAMAGLALVIAVTILMSRLGT